MEARARSSNSCILISASCTTGWLDWVHGELWLCDEGLLRMSLGFFDTLEHGVRQGLRSTVGPERATRIFDYAQVRSIAMADKRNRWIPWDEIGHATLKRGVIDHSLHLDLVDPSPRIGRSKFLWLKSDGGFEIVEAALADRLGDRFQVVRKPIG